MKTKPTPQPIDITAFTGPPASHMTLRDFFAGMAMMGNLASESPGHEIGTIDEIAEWSYKIADEMIEAKENADEHAKECMKDVL